jgi:hypothetical protein
LGGRAAAGAARFQGRGGRPRRPARAAGRARGARPRPRRRGRGRAGAPPRRYTILRAATRACSDGDASVRAERQERVCARLRAAVRCQLAAAVSSPPLTAQPNLHASLSS